MGKIIEALGKYKIEEVEKVPNINLERILKKFKLEDDLRDWIGNDVEHNKILIFIKKMDKQFAKDREHDLKLKSPLVSDRRLNLSNYGRLISFKEYPPRNGKEFVFWMGDLASDPDRTEVGLGYPEIKRYIEQLKKRMGKRFVSTEYEYGEK